MHLVFGQRERDSFTLRQVVERRLSLVFECTNCRRICKVDMLSLIARYGSETTIGTVRRRTWCTLCKHQVADALFRVPGFRSDQKWMPRPPMLQR